MKPKILALLIILLTTVVSAQDVPQEALFDGERALQHVADHVGVGPRPTATLGSIQAGNIILAHLETHGWRTAEDWHVIGFGSRANLSAAAQQTLEVWNPDDIGSLFQDRYAEADETIQFDPLIIGVRNLVASLGEAGDGGGTIIIGAHYDSRILSDKDRNPENRLLPMPGANDGGSGVGVLLELARVISEHYTPTREIRLVFFDAEDNGRIEPWTQILPSASGYIIGSTLYASRLDLDAENIELMLLVDLVGDIDQRFPIEGYSNQSAPEVVQAIWDIAADLGYEEQFPNQVGSFITDDHLPFVQRGIPSVDIIDLDYEFWDTSEDTLDKISAESLERVGRVLIAYLEQSGVIIPRVD